MSAHPAPHHHPEDAYLWDYASGALSAPFTLAIASHLALCNRCRHEVARIEALGGAAIETIEPVPITPAEVAQLLARLGSVEEASPPSNTQGSRGGDPRLPAPLRKFISASLEALPWRRLGPVSIFKLADQPGGFRTYLMRIRGGAPMPRHSHHGTEMTLVLDGGYTDTDGAFGRGDMAIANGTVEHSPIADPEGCLCFVVTENTLRMPGPVSGMVARWFGV